MKKSTQSNLNNGRIPLIEMDITSNKSEIFAQEAEHRSSILNL